MIKKIEINELKKLMLKALSIRGIEGEYAEFIVEDYIEAELEEHSSHGLSKFLLLDEALKQREGDLELVKELGNYAKVNGHKELGHVAGLFCVNKAIKLASEHGNSIIALNNASRYSRVKPFAKKIAQNGYIGIVLNNGGPAAVAPYGGTTPIFGTNPICFSFPSKSKEAYVFDFSTSKKVWAEIRQAMLEKRDLPEECFYDKEGNFTTDPYKADAVASFGGTKGYALCYAIEILTGAFVGAKMGGRVNDEYDLGFVFIALSPEMFSNMNCFCEEIDDLAQEVRKSRPSEEGKKVFVPGELSENRLNKNLQCGLLSVDSEIIDRISVMSISLDGGIESNNKTN